MLKVLSSHATADVITTEAEKLKYPPDGDIYALLIVLAVIAVFAVCMIISKRRSQKVSAPVLEELPAEKPVTVIPKAPGAAGQLKLYNVEPKTAAMIMAIVADKMGKPLNELRFLSIKEVE